MNRKIYILITTVLLLVLSQWLTIKMVYSQKITGAPAKFLATVYNLRAGTIEDKEGEIKILLKDFFDNKAFASELLTTQISTDDAKMSELVWNKLLKQAWLKKIAKKNNIEVKQEDVDFYIATIGGFEELKNLIEEQGILVEDYKHFLIEPDILEAKVYNYLLSNFEDRDGVFKIQEAYSLLEIEEGTNWDSVVTSYGEDSRLSDNSFWLAEEELVDIYEAIKELEVDDFSKIVQTQGGYVIWYLKSISKSEDKIMREVTGLFVYAKSIDTFLDTYLAGVNLEKKY